MGRGGGGPDIDKGANEYCFSAAGVNGSGGGGTITSVSIRGGHKWRGQGVRVHTGGHPGGIEGEGGWR